MTEEQKKKGRWRFNLRGSNTEPKLRLNVEADSQELMEEKTAEVLGIVTGIAEELGKSGEVEGLPKKEEKQ